MQLLQRQLNIKINQHTIMQTEIVITTPCP